MTQLALNVALQDNCQFESFFAAANNKELTILLQTDFWKQVPQVFIWGDEASGKSHLLQARCALSFRKQQTAAYLPLKTFARHGVDILDGLNARELIAVDDVQEVIGDLEWEKALYDLINQCRLNQQPLLMTSQANPRDLDCALPDLKSRLLWGPVYRLYPLSEARSLEVFRWRAGKRGLNLNQQATEYIGRHYSRDIRALINLLDCLDTESLNNGRKVTRQFVQEVLQGFSKP